MNLFNQNQIVYSLDTSSLIEAYRFLYPVVVTEEKSTGNLQHPRIRDVCKVSNIECVRISGIVKRENWIFE